MSDIPEKFLEAKAKVVLSQAEKEAMRSHLLDYVANNPINSGTLAETGSYQSLLQILINIKYMPIALLLIVILGGGTSLAAERSLPGDALYGVKTGVNENVRGFFTVGAGAEANWEARLVERRLEEGNKLEAKDEFDAEVEQKLANEVEIHVAKSQEHIATLESDGKTEEAEASRARLQQALAVHLEIVDGVKSDNASEQALEVRVKESIMDNVVNKLEIKLGIPDVEMQVSVPGETKVEETKVETDSGMKVEQNDGSAGGTAGNGGASEEATVKVETETELKSDAGSSAGMVGGKGSI
ncbi:MAG TPA: DUF5667 domain-containing protein [Candidatus Paceibacterota bacterium]